METRPMKNTARILLFTGDGKGKTTAAIGMAVRAGGHGMRTLVVQFIKDDAQTGEIAACEHLPGLEIMQCGRGFVPSETAPEFEKHEEAVRETLGRVEQAFESGEYDMVVLDEICTAVSRNLADEESVVNALKKAKSNLIVVMTGRGAGKRMIEVADTVTEMRCVKHGYRAGRKAQKGVEY